jgi:hypothetical protein
MGDILTQIQDELDMVLPLCDEQYESHVNKDSS